MTDLVKKLKLFGDQLDSAQQKVQFYFLFFFLSHSLSLFHVSRRQSRWSCPAQPLPLLLYFGSVLAFSAWLHIAVVGAAHLDNLVLKSMARAVSKVLPFTPFSLSLSLYTHSLHTAFFALSVPLSLLPLQFLRAQVLLHVWTKPGLNRIEHFFAVTDGHH